MFLLLMAVFAVQYFDRMPGDVFVFFIYDYLIFIRLLIFNNRPT